ncbi:MAG: tripartite tricarboxylate transporter substrate binding protein [Comamonadaceae bacterium]|nr:tripartite tricarboxylate transporter substrate binding protein [Comamonadaceae bacterium]
MTSLRKCTTVLAGMLIAASALAQQATSKPLTLMVPYPAGGPSDTIARTLHVPMGKALGQSVIVENLGGAGGAVAAQKVLSDPADGRTLFQGSANEVILAPLVNAAVKYKAEDFRLVHPVSTGVMVFVTRHDLPVNSADELIALARKNKDKPLTYGSVGLGSLYHLILEDVQQRKGVQFIHAPYKGNAPLVQDLGGGQVDFALLAYNPAMGAMAEQGRVKIIGQLGAQRSELLKQVPSVSEGQELKDFSSYSIWSGFFVPKGTPEPVVARLHQGIVATLKDQKVREQLAAQTTAPAATMSLEEAASFFTSETARYRAVAKAIKLQPQ